MTTRADILLVDDTPANLDLLCGMLRNRGYRVRVATSGSRALTAARAECPDLVMLDVNMPAMDGYEVCRELKRDETTKNAPIIFISALDDVVDKVRAFEAGGADYVTKPFEFGEVLARIENQLKIARLQREVEERNAELVRINEELRHSQHREAQIFGTLSDVLPGTVLDGKFRLESKIGSGGFGTVFRATQLNLERLVAVKIFQSLAGAAHAGELERFQREGISACRVNHPNALAVIDSGVSSGIAYLVMELLDGHTLADELQRNGPLSPQRACEIAIPICQVLAAAHETGVIHRDIKPDNVFLHRGRNGEVVKVLDFGIAKLMANVSSDAITSRNVILGTPHYMAPERLRNAPHDGRADIYSLAVMMYEMLTARSPFDDGEEPPSLVSVAMLHLSGTARLLRSVRPDVPATLETVIMRGLSKKPEERPTAAEMESELVVATMRAP
ncbi:MAG TPA: protein kinase [Thermoanaerobaculia bacterium]|nr:protein kinase [Thermoanaerobaculia bacterium]